MKKIPFKKLLPAFLALLFLISFIGCGGDPKQESPTEPPLDQAVQGGEPTEATNAPLSYDPAEDFQNSFGTCAGSSIWENEEILLFSATGYNYFGYYDKASGIHGVLCGKPECMHDMNNLNDECSGYAENIITHIGMMNGRILFVAYDSSRNPSGFSLYSMKSDSTDRRKLLDLPEQDITGAIQQCYLHRGYLYMNANVYEVHSGEPIDNTRFSRLNVSTGEFELIFDDKYESLYSGMCFIGNNVYMFRSSMTVDETISNVIKRFDSETGELETVLESEEQDFDRIMFRMWVDETENIYCTMMQTAGAAAVVYKVDGGRLKPIMDFADNEILFNVAMLSDGIVSALGIPLDGMGDEDEAPELMLWIRDFEGNTVYKGDFPSSFVRELGMDEFIYSDIQGDAAEFYIQFYGDEDEQGVPDICFVRFDIVSPSELNGELVFRSGQ